ncbi:hypothetical protein [Enterococcus villorum]|uniref:Lipoprotein n=2 Tax=Enterococcus villorum TaxID=112904 RepID=A0A511J0B2_9ENTE|nr:hypothetical protein [Enterococcus villorum]EOH87372.1 hypothetical protein UAO_02083 [Enterococcus villorum ATCC 700913]EOW77909.1 hypothetical protein I591_00763 [Enterococcus villorum ATCC 700913]GEL91083.1 hypothetical protein EVI01_04200 [Enterococcus villorum]
MRKISVDLLFLLVILLLVGCRIEVNSPQSARDDNYGVGTEKMSSTTSSDKNNLASTWSQTGTGDIVYSQLSLKKGAMILSVDFTNGKQIVIRLLDNDGTVVGTIKKKQTNYKGEQVIQITKDGDNYLIEIQSDGEWQINLKTTVLK